MGSNPPYFFLYFYGIGDGLDNCVQYHHFFYWEFEMSEVVINKDNDLNESEMMWVIVKRYQELRGFSFNGASEGPELMGVFKDGLVNGSAKLNKVPLKDGISGELVSLSISFVNGYKFILNLDSMQISPLMVDSTGEVVPITECVVTEICSFLKNEFDEDEFARFLTSMRLQLSMLEVDRVINGTVEY